MRGGVCAGCFINAEHVGKVPRFVSRGTQANMLAWRLSDFSVDASVCISPSDRNVPAYVRSLQHLLRHDARPVSAVDRLHIAANRADQLGWDCYALSQHKRADWVRSWRAWLLTQPAGSGVVDMSPVEILHRLAALIPPPRRHRHRFHGMLAPNQPLRQARTAVASGTRAVLNLPIALAVVALGYSQPVGPNDSDEFCPPRDRISR